MKILSLCLYLVLIIPFYMCSVTTSLQILRAQRLKLCNMLLGAHKSSYLGEPVSQLEHALQTADLVRCSGGGKNLTVGGLLHDIGHIVVAEDKQGFMTAYGALKHEEIGATFLMNEGFSAQVYEPVRCHVAAKRYLARDPNYFERISPASKCSLENQGGPMEDYEARKFECNRYYQQAILLRKAEDQAKVPRKKVPPLEFYQDLILEHLIEQQKKEFGIIFPAESWRE